MSENFNVSVIPATKRSVRNGGQFNVQTDLRVAAYCRVSTGDESQQTSYTTQKAFYTNLITNKPGWRFAGIYADEAISGTSTAHRVEFNRMMTDARAGKLDYIVSKSISRFARNTVDSLTCIRELRQLDPPVGVYFEKENIDTLDATGELILTILSALAQDESRSTSDNIRWSIQKNFQAGKTNVNLKRMLGYDKDKDGKWVINPEQAEIIRFIFENYLHGKSANTIASELNKAGKASVNGKAFSASSIMIILRNEKYVGDLEMQKTVTKDFLTHRSTINRGEAPKYYVENHHVGIIDRVTWNKVQSMLYQTPKKNESDKEKKQHPMAIKGHPFKNIHCGEILSDGSECGADFYRITYTGVANGYTDSRCLEAHKDELEAEGIGIDEYLEKYTYAYPLWKCTRRSGKREGEAPKTGTMDEKMYCRSKLGRLTDEEREQENSRCASGLYHEVALEQSFMELLYRLKHDYEEHGDAAEIVRMFNDAYDKAYQKVRNSSVSAQRMEAITGQIKELEEKLQETIGHQVEAMRDAAMEQNAGLNESIANGDLTMDEVELDIRNGLTMNPSATSFYDVKAEEGSELEIYNQLAKDIRERIEALKEEKRVLENEQGDLAVMKKNFKFFLSCLKALPDHNPAGMPLVVNGLDVQGSLFRDVDGHPVDETTLARVRRGVKKITPEIIAKAPDLLRFEKGLYCAFIQNGTAKGDIVTYKTNFGVNLVTVGNRRTLTGFLGFKRGNPDGTVEFVDTPYRVYDYEIQYRRRLSAKGKVKQEQNN